MEKLDFVRGNITGGPLGEPQPFASEVPSLKPWSPRDGSVPPVEPEFFPSVRSLDPSGNPFDQTPPQVHECGGPQQQQQQQQQQPQPPQQQPPKEEELDFGQLMSSLAPGGAD